MAWFNKHGLSVIDVEAGFNFAVVKTEDRRNRVKFYALCHDVDWLRNQLKISQILLGAYNSHIWELNIDGSLIVSFALSYRGLFLIRSPKA